MTSMDEIPRVVCVMHRLTIILLGLLSVAMFPVTVTATTVDRILAVVNNEIVTVSDYRKFMLQSGFSPTSDVIDEASLKKLIEGKIILAEAKKRGIDEQGTEVSQYIKEFKKNNSMSDAEFSKRLAEDGMTQKEFENFVRDNLVTLRFIERELESKIIVSEKEIVDYYRNNSALFTDKPERMIVRAIFLKVGVSPTLTEITDLKLKSLKIKAEILRGEPFEKLVDLYAEESLKSHDGIFGEFEKGAFVPELESTISSLKEGEISEPVWTKKGVYFFKMGNTIKAQLVPLVRVRNDIYALIYKQKREEKYNALLQSLWEKAAVTINH